MKHVEGEKKVTCGSADLQREVGRRGFEVKLG